MRGGSLPARLLTAALFLLACPADADAHSASPGMNDVLSGILHPFLTPAHVLILLGLGVLVGQRASLYLNLALAIFLPLSATALALTTTKWIAGVPAPILISIALVTGAAVTLDRRAPSLVCGALIGAAAIAIGLDSGLETGSTAAVIKTLLGTWIGLVLGLGNIVYYASLAAERKRQWMSIGLRVAGSWIVAISLLLLAFSLRK